MPKLFKKPELGFVTCVSDINTLSRYLLTSPCLNSGNYYQSFYFNVSSAAAAFNREMQQYPDVQWLVWAHQDVVLPVDWDKRFLAGIAAASQKFPKLAVVGVYGVSSEGVQSVRAGHVLDRGETLKEPAILPCSVDSLDEMLLAVRADSGLFFDPDLGFDFYATDVALEARQRGFDVAVVDAYCEHWSSTPKGNAFSQLTSRIVASAEIFEQKWAHCMPLQTPCFSIEKIGDVALHCRASSVGL